MDEEVKGLLHRTLKDIVTLEVTLFFHDHPEAVDSREGLSHRLARELATVSPALEALAQAGIVDRAKLGAGRYEVFSLTQDPEMRSVISRLNRYYHDDPTSRAEIIRHIVSQSIQRHQSE